MRRKEGEISGQEAKKKSNYQVHKPNGIEEEKKHEEEEKKEVDEKEEEHEDDGVDEK